MVYASNITNQDVSVDVQDFGEVSKTGLLDIAETIGAELKMDFSLVNKMVEDGKGEKLFGASFYVDPEHQIAVSEFAWVKEYLGTRKLKESKRKIAIFKVNDEYRIFYIFDESNVLVEYVNAVLKLKIAKTYTAGEYGAVFFELDRKNAWVIVAPHFVERETPGTLEKEMADPDKVVSVSEYNAIAREVKLKGSKKIEEILKRLNDGYKKQTMDGLR